MELTPRLGAVVTLLALVPVAVFTVYIGNPLVAIALVNVVLIFASLYLAFTPVEGHDHGHAA
jgi:general stress protein CsbA